MTSEKGMTSETGEKGARGETGMDETPYISLIRSILQTGEQRKDRTNIGTLSKFGHMMEFDLRDHLIPVITTRKIFWRGVVEELLWFIRGDTDAYHLNAKGVKIWDYNSAPFNGDCGPIYGFQWRHFGAEYIDCHTDYTGKGIDQLKNCIELIKKDPYSRRILVTSWNPVDIPKMCLPPCHTIFQFHVSNDNELSCALFQRSCDVALGVPFNIASYSLLTHMIAQVTNLKTGKFIYFMGDVHIYLNHIEGLKEQIKRTPRPFPKVFLNPSIKSIDEFQEKDITLTGYFPHDKIDFPLN
jgi:thymidylate synthase